MPTLNLVPAGIWENGSSGTAWTYNPGYADNLLKAIDSRYCQSIIPQGGLDSNGMWGITWVDSATGLQVNWSDKLITQIDLLMNASQITRPTTSLQLVIANWNAPGSTAQEVWNGNVALAGGAGWQYFIGGAVTPSGHSSVWDYVRDYIRGNSFVYSVLHYFHDADASQSQVILDALLTAVTYTTIVPPAVPSTMIWEF